MYNYSSGIHYYKISQQEIHGLYINFIIFKRQIPGQIRSFYEAWVIIIF